MPSKIEEGKCYRLVYANNPKFHVKRIDYGGDHVIYHGDWYSREDTVFRPHYFMLFEQFITPLEELPVPDCVSSVKTKPKIRLIRR